MGEIIKRIAKKNAEIDSILISIHDSQDKALAAGFTELYELYEELAKEFETQKKSNSMVMILMNQIHAKTE